jgi:biopolymer transport protein ExbD
LLKSFSTGVATITPSADVTLPEAKSAVELAEALKVEVTPNGISVEGKPVVELRGFALLASDAESDGTSRRLNLALRTERQQIKRAPASADDKGLAERLVVIADQDMPYALLQSVLASGTIAGFSEFRLLTVETE